MNKRRILLNAFACLALFYLVIAINAVQPVFSRPDTTATPSNTPADVDYLPYIVNQHQNPETPTATATPTSTATATATTTASATPTSTSSPTATATEPGIDVALVIDISDSMANDVCTNGYYPCVYNCNISATCTQFEAIKAAARDFLAAFGEDDRVTVIPFARQAGYCINPGDTWPDCDASAYDPSNNKFGDKYVPLIDDLSAADTFIDNLSISIPEWAWNVNPTSGPPDDPIPACPDYNNDPPSDDDYDPRQCTNTNLGGAVRAAATELLKELDPTYPGGGPSHPSANRQRVIVLITDGAPNAAQLGIEGPDYGTGLQLGYCPQYTWQAPPPSIPFCRAATPVLMGAGRHISTSVDYDAVDYVLDWADFALLSAPDGNGIQAYAVGIGNQVINASIGQANIGERVLRYIAAVGDDGDLATDPCSATAIGVSCGNYYYAEDGDDVDNAMQAIAQGIFE